MRSTKALVWFTQDLRIDDNPALSAAHANADSVMHAVFSRDLLRATSMPGLGSVSALRRQFLMEALDELSSSLNAHGHQLLIIEGRARDHLPQLIKRYSVNQIYRAQLAGYDEQQDWLAFRSAYPGIQFNECTSCTLYRQLDLPFTLAELPKQFTPFRKAIEKQELIIRSFAKPVRWSTALSVADSYLAAKEHRSESIKSHFRGGESQAKDHLTNYFSTLSASRYKETRNELKGFSNSTKFSPWLAQGSLSVIQVLSALKTYEQQHGANESTYWIYFELLWREFFFWTAKVQGKTLFRKTGRGSRVVLQTFYAERFKAWCNGSTPWAIVNAGMRELVATGYLSNRARQLVASCFVNELELDWRYGAAFFELHLLDYEVGSNWGNWQYLAGVGADPRGKRCFDLTKQTHTYDPDNSYITQWGGDSNKVALDSRDAADWPIS